MKKGAVTGVMSLLLVALSGGPASASCGIVPPMPRAIANAEAVFVGHVEEVTNRDRSARVTLSEVWKGEVSSDEIEIHGGPRRLNTISSVDRSFKDDVTYLFVLFQGERNGMFFDNACSATRPYRSRFDRLRPDDAQVFAAPSPSPAEESPPAGATGDTEDEGGFPLSLVGVAVAVTAGLGA